MKDRGNAVVGDIIGGVNSDGFVGVLGVFSGPSTMKFLRIVEICLNCLRKSFACLREIRFEFLESFDDTELSTRGEETGS